MEIGNGKALAVPDFGAIIDSGGKFALSGRRMASTADFLKDILNCCQKKEFKSIVPAAGVKERLEQERRSGKIRSPWNTPTAPMWKGPLNPETKKIFVTSESM